MSKQRIGFVGIGLIGRAMCLNLINKGYPLTVMAHRNRAPIDELVGKGAQEAANAGALALEADVIFICVTTSDAVEAVITGEAGLLSGIQPGTLVVDCGTSDPTSTARMGAALEAKGAKLIDAPLGRTPLHAEQGLLNMMVGGGEDEVQKVWPVLEDMAENIFHVGPLGSGHKLKLINNFFAMTTASAISEAAAMAVKTGVDLENLYKVMAAGPLKSGMFDFCMTNAMKGDASNLQFSVANARKDVGYYMRMAEAADMPSFIAPATYHLLSMAKADGRGEDYVPTLCDFVGDVGGVKLRD
ncbi:NAD(P)-dependent oxidoreductase [Denitrobaculum tricleocarpae]|uniref:NAD(P)-dependent oxidoreductase n=1 Tax=Denitrobaculum tricleocarpae TaxID=2591009 RepID=A0A545TF47_9PROT|nr:NAD(P)-dependent oxidoreductase [Denitrobaculum tricleocarpae]TQV75849.1 NAD(P)-dependent oxidoreductase [Denitrobaculum tricleocarpae]